MPVELSSVDDLELDQDLLDFAPENYCANCNHFTMKGSEYANEVEGTPYCRYWDDVTRIESGKVCPHYFPKGYE